MPSPHWAVADSTDADIAAMVTIEQDRYGPDAWSELQIREELGRVPDSRWYGAVHEGEQLVGYVGLYLAPPDSDIQTVTVRANDAGRGAGSALLAAALARARAVGCRRVFLEVNANNTAALALYTRFGFVRLGVRRRYYKDGSDAVNMRLKLDSDAPALGAP
ncbi:MAG: ribosomal protein S18-alanine N-acetyltransferase [Actinomycetia bacterium]|nr:ribosomal protein S18-alanine N-acetyltransferase [Actinomycetes bacterium]